MWIYLIAGFLFIVGVIGAFLGGGVFTIVLIPLALVILGGSLAYSWLGGGAQNRADAGSGEGSADLGLPHTPRRPSGRAPSSPEGLADARRAQQ